MKTPALFALFASLALCRLSAAVEEDTPPASAPKIAAASDEGRRAIAAFRRPPEFQVRLFAAEPLVANPVAFCVDHQGRLFVCESFRQNNGVTDNRGHDEAWLNDDLAAQTVEDRRAYHIKHLKEKVREYTAYDDRIRRLADTDGDGAADQAIVFAEGFHELVDGTGAGVLARGDNVYFTCIPKLYQLTDNNRDGVAEQRKALHDGYGVRVAFRGHDLHGLCLGPDGRLYFSIGDRGYNIRHGGKKLVDPGSGAVFRCELDGSDLEVIATGLRNPQELAFDDYGNLFTGDNNSDSGDKARWVYVVEGGDTGWRMEFQYLNDRGPFNREKIWHRFHAGQPAYIVPPVANLADGPSGLAYYPGVGLPEHYRGRFFLCDFRGVSPNSGIRTFRVRSKGAFFELADEEQTFWSILATDLAFGPDGKLYVSDWVNGWNGEGKGRIYQFFTKESSSPEARQVQKLLAEGMSQRDDEQLAALLAHADQRVRLEAQFALAANGRRERLHQVATDSPHRLARIHALWGLGQIARRQRSGEAAQPTLVALLQDADAELRAQAAKVAGDVGARETSTRLMELLADPQPRVRYFAAIALGKLGDPRAVPPLQEMLAENEDRDPILRHGGIMGLVGCASEQQLSAVAGRPSASVRLAAVVALRKRASAAVTRFLHDVDPLVVVEAARAIHDTPLPSALPQLAALIDATPNDDPLVRRVLNANYRLGTLEQATAVAVYAASSTAPLAMRLEALELLASWSSPSPRDRVLGSWRPLESRSPDTAVTAFRRALPGLLVGEDEVRNRAVAVAAKLGIKEAAPVLQALFENAKQPPALRGEALLALAALADSSTLANARRALSAKEVELRTAGLRVLAELQPDEAAPALQRAVQAGERMERQQALAVLAELNHPSSEAILAAAADELFAGRIPGDTRLDLVEALRKRNTGRLGEMLQRYEQSLPEDPVARRRDSLEGGNPERGRKIFFERTNVSCVRCHKVSGRGGEVGPELTRIAADKKPEYLLESIVAPNKTIAKDFESVMVVDENGQVISGVKKLEDDKRLVLMTAEGKLISLDQDAIEDRQAGKSAMPEDLLKHLSPFDLRDLIAFLSNLRG